MIEIHQSDYNPDELSLEVIRAIVDLLKDAGAYSVGLEQELAKDLALFEKVANGDDSNATRDEWLGAEDGWKALGIEYSIAVYDDGYAGYSYVGTEEEIEEFLKDQDEEEGD